MNQSRRYYGLNGLDEKLEAYLNYNGGFFIEIGANDGVTQSNTLYFEQFRNWSGILVEPTHLNYFKCRANRAKQTKVYCAACVPFGYTERFVPIVYANLMSVSEIPESDILDAQAHAAVGKQFLHPYEDTFTFGAEAKMLNDILLEAEAPRKIDLFSLDVEGVELQVLKGVDHDCFRFKYLLVECRALERLKDFLEPKRYAFVASLSEHDYLFRDLEQTSG
jgi:FkbM family methyltransferase